MTPLLGMPQGAEWLIILAIVVLLFGSAKLPGLVRQLGKSKKIWEEEVGQKKKGGELTEGGQPSAADQLNQPTVQQAQQPAAQPNQVNGPGDNLPPSHTAN